MVLRILFAVTQSYIIYIYLDILYSETAAIIG